ncbi:MAG: hypothetical protein Q8N53_01825 [Longimicrobiales bacterium]|nr:hypothetical protein [Longimicrobiales bacterium]
MTTKRDLGRAALALGIAVAALGAASPVAGQDVDPRWLPWLGCWQPASEAGDADLVCIRPTDDRLAVEILRVSGSDVVATEVVWADGRRHEASRESCTGWEEGAFSEDGRRLFLNSAFTCEGGVTQEGGGILAMTSPAEWLDVRVAGMGGESLAWVQRFRAADAAVAEAAGFGDLVADRAWAARTARMLAAASMDVDDVIEAAARVPEEAVQALLAERGDRLDLSAAELLRMTDAGVSEALVDVAIAVSYPERFRVEAAGQEVTASALDRGSLRRRYADPGLMGPGYYDPFYSPWGLRYGYGYGSRYGYGFDSYGYGYGSGYGGYYSGYRPTVVVVDRVEPEHGRVVNGRGYSRGGSAGSAGGSSAGPSRSGGASGGAGSAGGAGSGGGSSTGRTAKPRGGGGGDR